MRLEDALESSGHNAAVKSLEPWRRSREALAAGLSTASPTETLSIKVEMAELDAYLARCENALEVEYEQLVKLVDAENDLDFVTAECRERLELIVDEIHARDPEKEALARELLLSEE